MDERNLKPMREAENKPLQQHNVGSSSQAQHLLELAIAQLTGWHHAKQNGDRIIDLIESMGLSKKEWNKIKTQVKWLNSSDFMEIDRHFR